MDRTAHLLLRAILAAFLAVAGVAGLAGSAGAQGQACPRGESGRPCPPELRRVGDEQPYVIPRLTGPVRFDGPSDEAAWQAVPPLPLTQQTPTFGDPPSERTEIRLAYDDAYLYAAGRMWDAEPRGIRATSLQRDDGDFSNDWFAINIDAFDDNENALVFGTNPAGIRTDVEFLNDAQGDGNFDWNTFWDAAVRVTPEGWSAEIRIPLSSLRFQVDGAGRVTMGVAVWRRIARRNEMITWPAISPKWGLYSVFKASQFRTVALEGVHRRRPVYATPYVLGGFGVTHPLDAAAGSYGTVSETVRQGGLDLKYGVTSNLTLDATANTDFAQVEADDEQVNLTRFSLFFPEKRVFFQERSGAFDFSLGDDDRLFYSRRIGLAGDQPVPILGGARLVGRAGRWDLGILSMQTRPGGGEDARNFAVVRARRQLFNANSYVGGMLTSRLGAGGDYNIAWGADALVRVWGQDYLTIDGAQTFDRGDPGRVGALDRALLRAVWERRGEDGLTYLLGFARGGAAFKPEMGFLERSDFTRAAANVGYGWRPGRHSPLLRHALELSGTMIRRNAGGSVESAYLGPEYTLELKSGQSFSLEGQAEYEDVSEAFQLSDDAEVPAGSYRFFEGSLDYDAPPTVLFRPGAEVRVGSFYDGWRFSGSVWPTWNVSRHLTLTGDYEFDRITFPARDQRFTAHVVRLHVKAYLDSHVSAGSFVQYNSAARAVVVNARFHYNPREGDDFYVVYNHGLNTDRFRQDPALPLTDNRTVLLKYARTFGLSF